MLKQIKSLPLHLDGKELWKQLYFNWISREGCYPWDHIQHHQPQAAASDHNPALLPILKQGEQVLPLRPGCCFSSSESHRATPSTSRGALGVHGELLTHHRAGLCVSTPGKPSTGTLH